MCPCAFLSFNKCTSEERGGVKCSELFKDYIFSPQFRVLGQKDLHKSPHSEILNCTCLLSDLFHRKFFFFLLTFLFKGNIKISTELHSRIQMTAYGSGNSRGILPPSIYNPGAFQNALVSNLFSSDLITKH